MRNFAERIQRKDAKAQRRKDVILKSKSGSAIHGALPICIPNGLNNSHRGSVSKFPPCASASLRLCVNFFFFLFLASTLLAAERPTAKITLGLEQRRDLALTVYNNNYGLVRETREMEAPKGLIEIEYGAVADRIEATSVIVKPLAGPNAMTILEQSVRRNILTASSLLEQSVGKLVTVTRPRLAGSTESEEKRQGLLLSVEPTGTVIRFGNDVEINPPGTISLQEIPQGMLAKPALIWLVQNEQEGKQLIETSYLTNDINWKAEYVAKLGEDEARMDLTGWVTVENKSGVSFGDVKLRLVAGDVRRVMEPGSPQIPQRARAMAAEKADTPGFTEQSFADYHFYSLDRTATFEHRETKQLALFESQNVAVKKKYIFDSTPWARGAGPKWSEKNKVSITVEFENKTETGLGVPLPRGRIRAYKADSTGAPQFIGEDFLDHTAKDERGRLRMGDAFDVIGERSQTDFKQLSPRVSEIAYSITLRNRKEQDVEVVVIEHAYGDWEVVRETLPHVKKDSHTLEYTVAVPKGGETTVSYVYRVTQ